MKATARKKRSGKTVRLLTLLAEDEVQRSDVMLDVLAKALERTQEAHTAAREHNRLLILDSLTRFEREGARLARIRELLQSGTRDVSGTLWLKEAVVNELMELIQ